MSTLCNSSVDSRSIVAISSSAHDIKQAARLAHNVYRTAVYRVTKFGPHQPAQPSKEPSSNKWINGLEDMVNDTKLYKLARFRYYIPGSHPTFDTIIVPVVQSLDACKANGYVCNFLSKVSPDPSIRRAAEDYIANNLSLKISRKAMGQFYKLLLKACNKEELFKLSSEDRWFAQYMANEYTKTGLGLLPNESYEFGLHAKRMLEINVAFIHNVKDRIGKVLLSREELHGMPEDFFTMRDSFEVDGVLRYLVTTKYGDYSPIMKYATLEATRKLVFKLFMTRCPENVKLLQEAIDLRLKSAKLLGYNIYAEYILDGQLTKNPETVLDMLTTLRGKLTPLAKAELDALAALKESDCNGTRKPCSGFFQWDAFYYQRKALESLSTFRQELVKLYFSLSEVVPKLLILFGNVLGLQVVGVDSLDVWHTDVLCCEVFEADSDTLVGIIYLDLFARDKKSEMAETYIIRPGCRKPDGSYETPIVAVTTSICKSADNLPCLLEHSTVLVIAHELGHAFHGICSRAKWAQLNGLNTSSDYSELPSQLMEYFVWEPSVLRRIGVHYQTGEPMPEALIEQLVASRSQWPGLQNLRRIALAMADLAVHDMQTSHIDIVDRFNDLLDKVSLVGRGGLKTFGIATFTHLCNSNESSYFAYLWSEMYAADIFESRFLKDGLDNPQTGREYRKEILEPGAGRDPMINLERFLGRKPNNKAFLKRLGID